MAADLTFAGTPALAPVSLSKRQKAAIVVRLLRSEGIDLSLAGLPDSLQVGLTREMSNLRFVSRDTLRAVVEEFVRELDGIGLSFSGGLRGALTLLDGALSASAVELLQNEVGRNSFADVWDRLNGMDTDALYPLVAEESVEIGAVILSKLRVSKAAEILGNLPGETARRMAFAMGQTTAVAPETVTRIGEALLERLEAQPKPAFTDRPVERVGAILNFSPASTRDDVLQGLDREDKGFADEVRRAIFTFANIPDRLDPADVPKVVREVDATVLTTALKAAEGDAQTAPAVEFMLTNMSQRLAQQLRDEMEAMSKVRDGDAAMNEVVAAIRRMEAEQQIMLVAREA